MITQILKKNTIIILILLVFASSCEENETNIENNSKPFTYSIGASYTSNGTSNPSNSDPSNGDVTKTNGKIWLEYLADDLGWASPISSYSSPENDFQSPTNFARAGAQIINTQEGEFDLYRPKDAREQFEEMKTYIISGGGNTLEIDRFSISSFGNDIIMKYENSLEADVDEDFMSTLILEMTDIIRDAINMGFEDIIFGDMVALDLLPEVKSSFNPSKILELKNDIDYFNTELYGAITTLKGQYSHVTFYKVPFDQVMRDVVNNPSEYGFIDAVSTVVDENGNTNLGDTNTFMWWDSMHPSTKLHEIFSDETGEF
ncbi:MAG: hypothetical protein HRT66_13230 [Flavobacteriaceae bacterium]|nr:hypothetical protein [Flavobacteriaceae bacterium]